MGRVSPQEVLDLFAYVKVCAPDQFPDEDQTSFDQEWRRLFDAVQALHSKARKKDSKQFFSLCLQDLWEAKGQFADGNDDAGGDLLQSAEDFFERGVRGKHIKATFVASSDGVVASADVKDDERKH